MTAEQQQCIMSVRYITDNFGLFGFGQEDVAILQCTKELLENSIDACAINPRSNIRHQQHRISIAMKGDCRSHHDNSTGQLLLEVLDSGCGMDSPSQLLRCLVLQKATQCLLVNLGSGYLPAYYIPFFNLESICMFELKAFIPQIS